jgi:hypothetical protein
MFYIGVFVVVVCINFVVGIVIVGTVVLLLLSCTSTITWLIVAFDYIILFYIYVSVYVYCRIVQSSVKLIGIFDYVFPGRKRTRGVE